MPKEWTEKEERMYEHVRDNQEERAKEVAARTVNKHRREEGKTENKTSGGTGNPNKPLAERTVTELRNRAQELDISGRSSMDKSELVDAIRKSNG